MITLDATFVGDSEILLEWNKPDDNGSGFAGYANPALGSQRDDNGNGMWSAVIPID